MTPHPKGASGYKDATQPIDPTTKLGKMVRLLSRTRGATLADLEKATGWQPHSVRGAISGSLRKKHGLKIDATNDETRGRVYRLQPSAKPGGKS
jgi:uncharacterized protein DUF3489